MTRQHSYFNIIRRHSHYLIVGVITELFDNVTSGTRHLASLRGGRERYYEATTTKPLHWQAS